MMQEIKKFLFIAAAFAALVGCSKDASNPESAQSFVEGQTVTLSVSAPSSTKMSSKDDVAIKFTWQTGDKILVTVGDKSSNFTLKSGAGTSSATFEGKMPASGDSFDAQYPVDTPDISSQTYSSSEAVPHDEMLFKAEECTLDEEFKFEAQNAVLCLNLYGIDQTISKIDVKNAASYTITLNISDGELPTTEAEAKPFYIVVPAGSYAFSAVIYDNAATPAKICSLSPSAAKTFTNGGCLNMDAKEVKKPVPPAGAVDLGLSVYWADHNVGATNPEDYGNMYQWAGTDDVTSTSITLSWSNCPYHTGSSSTSGWTKYNTQSGYGTVDNKEVLDLSDDVAHTAWGGSWRMPTDAEWTELRENCTWTWTTINGINGYQVTSNKSGYTDKSIFLPAAGYRSGGSLSYRGSRCRYWSSSLRTNSPYGAWAVYFYSGYVDRINFNRFLGQSVRPVSE